MNYDSWLTQVNMYLIDKCGAGIEDLPDWCYFESFEEGVTPEEAAEDCYEYVRECC